MNGHPMKSNTDSSRIGFRPAEDNDLDLLRRIYASTRAEEMALVDWPEAQKADFLAMQFAAQHKYYRESFNEAEWLIVRHGAEDIGRLYLDRREDEIRIIDIALLPDWRGRGIGSMLLRDILEESRHAGKPVLIHVEHNNPALRLYHRLGFRRIGDTGVYYLMKWTPGQAG